MYIKLLIKKEMAQEIIKKSIGAIGTAGYISWSINHGKDLPFSFYEVERKIANMLYKEAMEERGACVEKSNEPLKDSHRKILEKEVFSRLFKGEEITFAPFKTISGDRNSLSIQKIDDDNYIVIYQGRRAALFAAHNCLAHNYFYEMPISELAEIEVLEHNTQAPKRAWYDWCKESLRS